MTLIFRGGAAGHPVQGEQPDQKMDQTQAEQEAGGAGDVHELCRQQWPDTGTQAIGQYQRTAGGNHLTRV